MNPKIDLFTIGYEGRNLDSVLALLHEHGVDTLIDVRHTPWSHKRDFRQKPLSEAVEASGLRYVHLPQLGVSAETRKALKDTGDREAFAASYVAHLNSLANLVEEALAPFRGARACFLCLEADYRLCHRSLLAQEVVARGLASAPTHL